MNLDETIAAIATPPGRGGIGIVRLSGAESKAAALSMLRLAPGAELEPQRAQLAQLFDRTSGERLDEVVVTWFAAPHSYTTEDVVEIACHGAPVILERVLTMAMEQANVRLAEPGEFTARAFFNGRLDLTQAEAVRDLIDAQTLYQAKIAARQLKGELSRVVRPIKDSLLALIAGMEAGIDFAEDDVEVMPAAEILLSIAAVDAQLGRLESSFRYGRLVRDGLMLAIVGRPNVGKSSLFNRLVQRERAIVTAQPGTTRDLVSETVSLGGIPVRLFDTAGLREASDEAENIGIRKSMEALADADLVLMVLDASAELTAHDHELMDDLTGRAAIVVINKHDLGIRCAPQCKLPVVYTSALTGEGIPELRESILRQVHASGATDGGTLVTNLRQQQSVGAARKSLSAAAESVHNRVPHEMILLDLYGALHALDELTGATTADDILNRIFSTFCIGK